MQRATAGDGHASSPDTGDDQSENNNNNNHRRRSSNQPIGRAGRAGESKKERPPGPLPLEPLTSPDRTMGINSIPYPQRLEPVKIPLRSGNIIVFTIKSLSVAEVISVLNRARIEDTGASQCFSGFLLAMLPIYIVIQIVMWSILISLYSSLRRVPCLHDLALWALIEGVTGFSSLILNASTTIVFKLFVDPINPTRSAVIFNWFKLIVGVFGFAWTMVGTVWTFSLARAAPSLNRADCSPPLFRWSFAYCMFYWCIVAPLFLFMFFAIFVRIQRIAARHRNQPQHLPPPSRRLSSQSYSAPPPSGPSRSLHQKDSASVIHTAVSSGSGTDEPKRVKRHDHVTRTRTTSDVEQKDNDSRTIDVHAQQVVAEDRRPSGSRSLDSAAV